MRGLLLKLASMLIMTAPQASISVDSPFVPGLTAVDAWTAQLNGHPPVLPVVHIELDHRVVFDGPLVASGSPKSHLYFALGQTHVRAGAGEVVLGFSIESRGLHWEQRVDLRQGVAFILTEGTTPGSVVLEQLRAPRYYQ